MNNILDTTAALLAQGFTPAQVTTILATLDDKAPAKVTPAAPKAGKAAAKKAPKKAPTAKQEEFHAWLVATGEARAQRKTDNKAHSAWLDANRKGWRGAANKDSIWGARKAGKRVPAVKA